MLDLRRGYADSARPGAWRTGEPKTGAYYGNAQAVSVVPAGTSTCCLPSTM